jgi:7-cyano-7-deazaguanine synthase
MKEEKKSLYEYLGYAAGMELGGKVWGEACNQNVPIEVIKISNSKYQGDINKYPISFLDKYFGKETPKSIPKKYAVISLSGGMDSSTLLLRLLSEGYDVTALSFDYGQKHKVELEKATELVEYLNKFVGIKIKHQIIKLDGLSQLLNSSLVEGGKDVPEGHYAAENMKETVVPNRNKIFSSIIQAVALSIAEKNNTYCDIAMGIHAGDHAIYLDCRQEFRDADFKAFIEGNEKWARVSYYTPYLKINKFGILQDGENCCKSLGLDFDEVYKRTNTSYKPILITGTWYSDHKSASSVERIEAFIKLGRPDPVGYANEFGPVSWEIVKEYVSKVLKEHQENEKLPF